MKSNLKKALSSTLIVLTLALSGFALFEPTGAGAAVATSSVVITLNVTAGISITDSGNSTMSTSLGIAQDTAIGTTTFNVKTNAAAGYTLAVNSTSTPAMNASTTGLSIPNYQTGIPNTWSTPSGNAYFGYSAFGTDVSTSDWGTGSVCNGSAGTHATSTTLKYRGFTTSPFTVATRAATTTPSGVTSTICYAVEQNGMYIAAGTYQATIVATATTL